MQGGVDRLNGQDIPRFKAMGANRIGAEIKAPGLLAEHVVYVAKDIFMKNSEAILRSAGRVVATDFPAFPSRLSGVEEVPVKYYGPSTQAVDEVVNGRFEFINS